MAEVKTTCREELLAKLREDTVWDVVVIGGGATGAGIAVDAASRGLKTVVLEAQDFSSGTSSRSTKLIHGGVRYMKNPRDWGLVREALKGTPAFSSRMRRISCIPSPSSCLVTRRESASSIRSGWAFIPP